MRYPLPRIALAACAALLALTGPLHAAVVGLRSGDHPGFGRLVIDLPAGTDATLDQDGAHVSIHVAPPAPFAATPRAPRNVGNLVVGAGQLELALAEGATLRRTRLHERLILDILDPAKPLAPQAATPPTPGPPRAQVDVPASATVPQAHPAPMPAAAPIAPRLSANRLEHRLDAADRISAHAAEAPMQLAAKPAASAPGSEGHAILLPFDANVGAAAFRRGGIAVVIFDQRRPIDMAALRDDPVFASGAVQLLPTATMLRLAVSPQDRVTLARDPHGWTVGTAPSAPALQLAGNATPGASGGVSSPIHADFVTGALRLLAQAPGQVISVPDPETGAALLVGTQRQAGQSVPVGRRLAELQLFATWQGVVVEALSDQLAMRPITEGFLIEAGPGEVLALDKPSTDAAAEADASYFTRRFDFPALPSDALFRRMQAAVVTAAAAPQQARAGKRIAAAEAMLALGLGAEAQSILTLAGTEDARVAEDPDLLGLSAIAALLAGRTSDSAGLEDPRLTGTDEIALWRGARAAMLHEGAPDAVPALAANLPLLLAYPAALRDRLLPLAAETLALGGEAEPARRLLAKRPDDHRLDLARAFLLDQDVRRNGGDPAPALVAYAKVAAGPDRLAHARAATNAVELRLACGQISATQAADAMDRLLYAWRGDGREITLRLREAELRQKASAWRPSLALLRETEALWPEQRALLRARMGEVFTAALGDDAHNPLPPIDLVALADENADLIPDGAAGQALAARLADRLAALDLPKRAIPVLEKLAANAPPGPVRAEFGGRLAAMRLAGGDATGALAALTKSSADALPAPLLESRTMTFAKAAAAAGDLGSASAALAALDTADSARLRADLSEAAQNWPETLSSLRSLARHTVPPDGKLTDQQAGTLLRLASAAAQSGDDATLAALRDHDMTRIPEGKLADMFRLLTEGPVRGVADLPRAAQEVKLARDVSAAVKTLTP